MNSTFEFEELISYIKQFIGKSFDEIAFELNFNSNAKSKNYLLVQKLLFNFKNKDYVDTLLKFENIIVKTIQLKINGKSKEAMSFPPIKYEKIINEEWDSSDLKCYLVKKFLFFIFKINDDGTNNLLNIILWQMPYNDLEGEVKQTWSKTKDILLSGNVIKKFDSEGVTISNFPTEASTNICHVRPHGRNGLDVRKIPNTDNLTGFNSMVAYSFWFNHEYLNKIVENYKGLKGD